MFYKVVERQVGQFTPDGQRVKKWYAKEVAAGRSTFEMIADKIEERCTVTRPDILAVLAAFVDDIKDRLQAGQIVELGELGNLQLTIQNRGGAETREEWSHDLIKKANIVFRPAKGLRDIASSTTFTRWTSGEKEEEEGQ